MNANYRSFELIDTLIFHDISSHLAGQTNLGDLPNGQLEMHFVGDLQEIQAQEKKIVDPHIRMSRGELACAGEAYTTTYRIFREHRPPPPSGNVGDIWLDLSAQQIFYFDNAWNSWLGNTHKLRHPFLKDYKLYWSEVQGTVAWRSSSTISRLNKKFTGLEEVSAQRAVELIKEDLLLGHFSPGSRSTSRKRKRGDLSVEPSPLHGLISMSG